MFLFMWAIIFVFTFIPGGLVGWLIGLIPIPRALQWTLLVGVSVAAGFVVSRITYKGADLTIKYHFENLTMFLPPILLAMMAGLRFSRAKPPQPW